MNNEIFFVSINISIYVGHDKVARLSGAEMICFLQWFAHSAVVESGWGRREVAESVVVSYVQPISVEYFRLTN